MSNFDYRKTSDWWAAGGGLTIISVFPTAIMLVWCPEWWTGKSLLLTEIVLMALCYLGHQVTKDDQ